MMRKIISLKDKAIVKNRHVSNCVLLSVYCVIILFGFFLIFGRRWGEEIEKWIGFEDGEERRRRREEKKNKREEKGEKRKRKK